MVIQHNIAAVNAYRNLNANQSSLSKNLEKLSSGYRINRAADDAAGLAISESMRSKINGLDQATANANDAIGLIQTEEGALTETHSMLQRMTTLATQAANGTYNETSRASIQKEMDELGQEINRIANNTDYNGIKPLAQKGESGQADTMTMQIGATKGETLVLKGQDMTLKGIFGDLDKVKVADASGNDQGELDYTAYMTENGKTASEAQEGLKSMQEKILKDAGYVEVKTDSADANVKAGDWVKADQVDASGKAKDGIAAADIVKASENPLDGTAGNFTKAIAAATTDKDSLGAAYATALDSADGVAATGTQEDGSQYLQIISGGKSDPTANANQVVSNIQKAIDHVSSYRAELGAKQNRLEHTINNLKVTSENTTAAESRIRDTDMAKEIASYTKNNILSQAAQSMLAQANQSGQGVLSLLQ